MGDVLRLARRAITVSPTKHYREIGLRSFGRGIFHKDPVSGADLGTKRVFEIANGDLVISNVFAWEGAVAVASSHETGLIGSHRFMTWVARSDDVDPRFVFHYFVADYGLAQLQRASPGSAGRNRTLGIQAFEELTIPLPDIDDQRAIAVHLDLVSSREAEILFQADQRSDALRQLPALLSECFARAGIPLVRAEGLYNVVSDIVHPGDDPAPAKQFVGLEHIERDSGRRIGSGSIDDLRGRKLRFLSGDVLYGYLRPYLNKAWAAETAGLCSVEQYVLRPNRGVSGPLLSQALRSATTLAAVIRATHSLQLPRIRTALLGSIEVPDVRKADRGLCAQLRTVETSAVNLAQLHMRHEVLTEALVMAARNEVFSKLV